VLLGGVPRRGKSAHTRDGHYYLFVLSHYDLGRLLQSDRLSVGVGYLDLKTHQIMPAVDSSVSLHLEGEHCDYLATLGCLESLLPPADQRPP